jgi:antagonist of KipI
LGIVDTLEIMTPGPLTTVQDLGRPGFARYGVPPSGALDSFSLRIANLLVGNPEKEAALEVTLMGLKVRALADLAIALTGGNLQPHLNGNPLDMWRSHVLKEGDILSFKGPGRGCRAYLALGGGLSVEPIMGSKSTNLSSRFGGFKGRPLQKGDILSSDSPYFHLEQGERMLSPDWIPHYATDWLVRVIPGPQQDDFTEAVSGSFLGSVFAVTPQSDRTGIRLAGPAVQRKEGAPESIISEAVVPGTIQIPGDGQPIIILVETVTGGYRKIATVITADLPLLGQVKPGDRVRFHGVSLDEACVALREFEERIERFKAGFNPQSPHK